MRLEAKERKRKEKELRVEESNETGSGREVWEQKGTFKQEARTGCGTGRENKLEERKRYNGEREKHDERALK